MLAHRKSRMKKLIKKEYFMSFKEYSAILANCMNELVMNKHT